MTSWGTSSMWKQCNVLLWLPITHYTTHHGQMVGFVCTQGDVDSCGKLVMVMVFGEICTWPLIRDLWLWHASWMCVQTLGVNYNDRCTANQNFSHNLWKIMRWKNRGMWWAYHSCPWFRAILFSLVNYFTYSANHDLTIHYSSPAPGQRWFDIKIDGKTFNIFDTGDRTFSTAIDLVNQLKIFSGKCIGRKSSRNHNNMIRSTHAKNRHTLP